MKLTNVFLAALMLSVSAGTAFGAIGTDEVLLGNPRVAAADSEAGTDSRANDAARLRQAGEDACREAVNTAVLLGDTFRQVTAEVLPLMLETGTELARQMEPRLRELAPTMRQFGDRLRDIMRQMEQPARERRYD